MWRPLFLLSLIAALFATPLRQAEAADDFSRALASAGDVDIFGEADGGVGDDSGATILKAGGDSAHQTPDLILVAAPLSHPRPFVLSTDESGRRQPFNFPASSGRRHAWLQRFLL